MEFRESERLGFRAIRRLSHQFDTERRSLAFKQLPYQQNSRGSDIPFALTPNNIHVVYIYPLKYMVLSITSLEQQRRRWQKKYVSLLLTENSASQFLCAQKTARDQQA